MKKVAVGCGVSTPAWAFVYDISLLDKKTSELSYPLIVKQHAGYGSMGLYPSNRVEN